MNKFQIFNQGNVRANMDMGWEYLKYSQDYISEYYNSRGSVNIFDAECIHAVRLWQSCRNAFHELNCFIKDKELRRIELEEL